MQSYGNVPAAVNVRVTISETGCVTQAAVAATSGASDLDVAALQLAMAGSYRPGMKSGKAVAGDLTYRIKFELRE